MPIEFTPFYHGVPIKHKQRMYEHFCTPFYRSLDAVYVEPKGFQCKVGKYLIKHSVQDAPEEGDDLTFLINEPVLELTGHEIAVISS